MITWHVPAYRVDGTIKTSTEKNRFEKLHRSGLLPHHADRQHCDKSDACEFSVPEVALHSSRIDNSGSAALLQQLLRRLLLLAGRYME